MGTVLLTTFATGTGMAGIAGADVAVPVFPLRSSGTLRVIAIMAVATANAAVVPKRSFRMRTMISPVYSDGSGSGFAP